MSLCLLRLIPSCLSPPTMLELTASHVECGLNSKHCDSFIISFRKSVIIKKNIRSAVTTPKPSAPDYGIIPKHWNCCSFSWYMQCLLSIVLQLFGRFLKHMQIPRPVNQSIYIFRRPLHSKGPLYISRCLCVSLSASLE